MSVIIAAVSLTSIAPYLIDFSRAASAAAELFRLMDRDSEINPFEVSGVQPTHVEGNISFQDVSFAYPMRPSVKVLDNFSLNIPAGKVTALVGASGSGKSTIIGLIERWYNPGSGSIFLDGQRIEKLNLAWLRKHCRLVQQEPVLFAGSIFDNIANGLVGTPWQDEPKSERLARVQEAAKIAFAHDFITDLPNGYDTVIGERGGLLSGGQKQRVAIARSVVSQPRILLLDEATSALDPHAEEVVQKALDNVSKGRTTITIAHKLATIRNADNIVVMSSGSIVEQGTHHSLLASNGAYARLVKAQDLTVASSDGSISDSGDEDGGNDSTLGLAPTQTRNSVASTSRFQGNTDREDYDKWKRIGLLHTIWRLFKSSPELKWAYIVLMLACVASGKNHLLKCIQSPLLTMIFLAASYPGQAILMSRFIDVFQLTGDRMRERGNFFALMFLVIACGSLVAYFALGFASNIVAQVSGHSLTCSCQSPSPC